MEISVTVDLVILTIRDQLLHVLLVRRGIPPYRGRWALPGGFLEEREDLSAAAARELEEETGLALGDVHLEQLRTYGAPGRDPRGRVVTVAHLALAPDLPAPIAGSDAAHAEWVPVDVALARGDRLAFDHLAILTDGVERARSKLEYTPLGTAFCPEEFTVGELRRVYEAVWGRELDPRNFHRKVTGSSGFLADTGERTNRDGGRPARLYRRGTVEVLHPPLLRGD
ncbi:NUDIX hydrolase [Nocardioides cynanchi]|uniref:NUDIX hydrolase n=1 Tax=Nocardioides cynanchi TaxID=2558918 RepID=UPI0012461A8A|nr:NUDIX domain-containing protein [Nocardioides cynanchi]